MSGPFGSSQWMYASGGFYPYQIEQSLRFNDDDSAYLSRTPASAGNRKTWTWSGWVKRGNLGTFQYIFGGNVGGSVDGGIVLSNTNNIGLSLNGNIYNKYTSAVFRDTSAWYHIVVALDTDNATAADRIKIYVNGVEQTNYFTQNSGLPPSGYTPGYLNNANNHDIGKLAGYSQNYFDGYMAEVNFIDGLALDPTSFGETKSGIWVPKAYSGSYGTNGFYLSFADSANIGDDLSGNGNDWTANNLVSTDVLLDSPTQNWCVLNPLQSTIAPTNGNLEIASGGGETCPKATIQLPLTGKWYWETYCTQTGTDNYIGVTTNAGGLTFLSTERSYRKTGIKSNNGVSTSYGAAWASGDTLGVAVDMDAGSITFYKNNVSQGVAFTDLAGVNWSPHIYVYISAGHVVNFGQDSSFAGNKTAQGNTDANGRGDFYYAPPAGFLALCTANLPDPAIDPAQDDVPADYFNTVTWTGTNTSAGRSITGVGFQPDFVFSKSRSDAFNWNLYDNVRGTAKRLMSNNTNAEETNAAFGYLSSFDSDGFTTAAGATNNENWNKTSSGYVAWNWLAGNGTSSNTDGSITSTVSVNQKAGFSVVSYTGNGTAGSTVGHGLDLAPELVIAKSRTGTAPTNSWHSYHASLGATQGLILNGTNAASTDSGYWSNTAPTSSVITVGTYSSYSSQEYIIYAFHSVEGYSKFGSYTGNGSTDGTFVYTGFRPAFVLTKRVDTGGYSWGIADNQRSPFNQANEHLFANASDAEYTTLDQKDLLSNGFKHRTNLYGNLSGGTYIFMAFAEQPFKFSNAR